MSEARQSSHPHHVQSSRRPPRAGHHPATNALEAEHVVTQRRCKGRRITPADVRRARDVVAKCATLKHLKRYSALGEVSCQVLTARIGRRLSRTEEQIYGAVRRAVRSGRAGLAVTVADLVWKSGSCERAVQYALDGLGDHRRPCDGLRCKGVGDDLCDGCARPCAPDCGRHVDLVRTVPQFAEVPWTELVWPTEAQRARGLTVEDLSHPHDLRQLANAYVLGRAARRPGPRVDRRRAVAKPDRHCTPKAFSPLLRKEEKQEPRSGACGQPAPGEEREGAGPPAGGIDPAGCGRSAREDRRIAAVVAERLRKGEMEPWLARWATTRNESPQVIVSRNAADPTPHPESPAYGPLEAVALRDDTQRNETAATERDATQRDATGGAL